MFKEYIARYILLTDINILYFVNEYALFTAVDMLNAAYHDMPLIFIKAVSDTVLDMINAAYYDEPLISIKAVSGTVLGMINTAYYDKPLMFIGDTFQEKLVFHHRAVNEADSCLLMRRARSKPWHQNNLMDMNY